MIALLIALVAAGPVDLDTARQRAVDRAITVARAEEQADAARGRTWLAASGALPDVSLFANASTGAGLTSFGFERPVRTQTAVGLTGTWTVIAPGSWAAAVAARHTVLGRDAMVAWARVDARQAATVAIADLWAAEAVATALNDSADDAERGAGAVRSLVDSGLRPPADLARTQATAASLRARAATAEGQVVGACARLQALLRDTPDGRCALAAPEVAEPQTAPGTHPALVAAQQALASAQASRTQAILERGPTVTGTGTVGRYSAGDGKGVGWSAGVQANLPLLSGGAGLGNNRVAVSLRDDAALAFEDQTLSLDAAAVAAEARFRAATIGLDALSLADDAAEQAMDLIDGRYGEGLVDLEGWLSARRDRDEARVALAEGRAERLRALAQLESVRGVTGR